MTYCPLTDTAAGTPLMKPTSLLLLITRIQQYHDGLWTGGCSALYVYVD